MVGEMESGRVGFAVGGFKEAVVKVGKRRGNYWVFVEGNRLGSV